mgnify:FL=1
MRPLSSIPHQTSLVIPFPLQYNSLMEEQRRGIVSVIPFDDIPKHARGYNVVFSVGDDKWTIMYGISTQKRAEELTSTLIGKHACVLIYHDGKFTYL